MNRRASSGAAPPFSREVIDARERGEPVNLFIYCGADCWDMAKRKDHAIVVATPQDGEKFNWRRIVGGLPGVTLIARNWPAAAVDMLARVLILSGAKLVVAIRVDSSGAQPRISHDFYKAVRK